MSFLTIPSPEGLFTTVKAGKSAEDGYSTCPVDGDADDDEEDEDDGSEEVHFIPRCSPIPRKRGQSIYDETAEYMRIHLSLPAARRVSFADTTGGDLVDVKEFVAFGSDEEEDPTFEAENACYRKHSKEPTYRIHTEFDVATRGALAQAVQTNKVEVELLSPVENEPLAFSGLVRVLNISYHKAVSIRSTMDHWATYFDHPAEYVQGSNDGETDAFCFKLSFAPPYDTHGSRMEFVVRYETSDGDFWANNSHMNYVVTLLVSNEDHVTPVNTDTRQEIRGILKTPKVYSVYNDGQQHMDEEDLSTSTLSEPARPPPVCPVIIHPEMDLETAGDPFGVPLPPDQDQDLQSRDGSSPRRSPRMSSRDTTDEPLHGSSQVRPTLQSSESAAAPPVPCGDNQVWEQLEGGSRSSPQPNPTPWQPRTPSSSTPSPSTPSPSTPSPSTSSLAEDVEQGKGSLALDKLKPLSVTRRLMTEASLHFSTEVDEEETLCMTLGDRKIKVAQIFSRGEKDLLNEKRKQTVNKSEREDVSIITHDNTNPTKDHFNSEFNEHQSESSLEKEISLNNLRSVEIEEALQTAPLASLDNLGAPGVPPTPAAVMLSEQPPDTSSKTQHSDAFETSMATKVENIDTVEAHSCMSKRLESMSTDSETQQGSREMQAVLRSHSDHSDKEQNTKIHQVYEEQATLGDTAAFFETGEMVQQGTAGSDIGQTNGEGRLAHQSTNTDKPFLVQFGTSVKNNLQCESSSETITTQASLVDTNVIFSNAFDNLKETNPRPGEESTDLVSSETWFTPTAPESPPSHGWSPPAGPSELPTTPPVGSTGSSPLNQNGEEEQAATSNAVADDTSTTADVNGVQGRAEVVEPAQVSSDALAEQQLNTSLEADEPLRWSPECNTGRNLRLSIVFLCALICVSVVLKEPNSLFFVGLALVALFFFLMASD